MSIPKTPEDHKVIAFRILQNQDIPTDVISQIIVHIDGAMRLTKEQTIAEILSSLSKTITVAQQEDVIRATRSL